MNNILFKIFLLLVLALGWGSSAWAQGFSDINWQDSNFESRGTYDLNQAVMFMTQEVTPTTGGNLVVNFKYDGGNKGLDVYGVDLVDNTGAVVTSAYNAQFTGGSRNTISYTLSGLTSGTTYTMRAFTAINADDKSDWINGSNTCQGIISYSGTAAAGLSLKTTWNLANERASWKIYPNAPSEVLRLIRAKAYKPFNNVSSLDTQIANLEKGKTTAVLVQSTTGSITINGVELLDGSSNVVASDIRNSSNSGIYVLTAPATGTFTLRILAQSISAGATGTVSNPSNIKFSNAPQNGDWAPYTAWHKIQNVRASKQNNSDGYMSTAADHKDSNGNLKLRVAGVPEDNDENALWCVVPSGSGSFYIYNKAAGVNQVMGTINNAADGASYSKMYEGTGNVSNVTKTYNIGTNGNGFWICLSGTNKHLDDASNGFLGVWNNVTTPKSQEGNRFIFTEVQITADVALTLAPVSGSVVYDLSSITLTADQAIMFSGEINKTDSSIPVVKPFLRSAGADDIEALSVEGDQTSFTITFPTSIPLGSYTLVIPDGTFYVNGAGGKVPVSGNTASYTIATPPATKGYRIIIKGDDGYAVSTTEAVTTGRQYAYNNEFLDLAAVPAANDLRSLTIDAPEGKFVWGPIIDATNKTITFEVKPAVTSLTTGKWYQVQILPKGTRYHGTTGTSNMVESLNNLSQIARKSQYLYFYQHDTYSNNYPLDIAGYYSGKDMQSYIYIPSVGGNANSITAAFQTVTGRYVSYQGIQQTSDAAQSFNLAPQADSSLAWNGGARPWYNLGSPQHLTIGWSGSNQSQCFFTYFAEVDPTEQYDVYRVSVTGGTNATTVTYTPAYNGVKQVYNGGYFFFAKGYKPTAADFTVAGGVTFTSLAVDVEDTGDIRTLVFRQRQAMMGSAVNVVFKTTDEKEVSNATAYFNAPDGTRHELTAGQTYDLSAYEYIASRFSVSDEFRLISVNYTEATQTLTFVLLEDMMSPALVEGNWAEGTKWYTIKNVRRNSLMGVTSSHSGYDDKIYFTDGAGDANSPVNWWCFVPDGDNGFVMYNKAFGPDFVLAVNSNYPQMTHKEEIAGKVYHYHLDDHQNPDAFTIYHNASHNGNAPAFNDVSHYLGTWNTSEANIKGTGNGSDFIITRVDNSLVEAAPLYTPYKIISVSVTGNDAPANAGANSTVAYKNGKYAGGSYSRKQGSYIVVRNDHALVSVTAPDARCNDLRVSTLAMGASSITIGTSSTNPAYKTISIAGTYDVTTKYIVHRPNGLLWTAKKNKIDGTESYTVGTQTPDYVKVNMNGREVYLQNTNQVEVTHFFKPGDDAMPVWFTTTSSSSNGHKPIGYARMFNYNDEFDNTAIGRDHNNNRIVSGTFLTQGGTTAYLNGYANKNVGSGYGNNFTVKFPAGYTGSGYTVAFESSRMKDVSDESYANGDEPTGAASYICDFDGSGNAVEGFTDPNDFPGVVNMLESTIAQRQIFHLLPASVIADKLYAYQGTEADAAFMEEETIMFPTKNTEWTTGGYNGAQFHNVIPLGYNAVDYWGYADSGKSDVFHLNHKSNAQAEGLKLYATVVAGKNDAGITINTGNNAFTGSTGIFTESTGSEHSRLASRFVTFCYPNNGVIGDGTQQKTAVIEVRLTNGTMTYNVKRFTLVFVPNTDPIPYDEIIGHDEHIRSDATLEARFGKPYEEMKFKMPAQYNFTLPGSELHDMGHAIPTEAGDNNEPNFQPQVTSYYQFPMDFSQMSYNYYGGTRYVDWGEYGLRHYNTNSNYVPVNYLRSKYAMEGLKSKQAEYQAALERPELTDAERANYQQLLDDATQSVAKNQSKMEDEYYNGYFIYCDASEQPGEMAKLKINETLCPGTQFFVTAWMSNGTDYSNQSPNPNSVIFRIKGRRTDNGEFEQIAAYCPGQISLSVRTKDRARRNSNVAEKDPAGNNINVRPWQQVAFSFTNTAPSTMYDEFRLEVDNNSRGSAGSDIYFDNVRLYVKRPTVEVRDAAPVCGTSLDLVRITTDFDAMMESIKGNSAIGSAESGTNTYYGVYAVLNKTKYDSMLSQIKNPTRADLAKAFMAAVVGKTNEAECLYDDDNNPSTPTVMDKSLYAFHTIKFYDRYETHQEITYNQLISSEEFEEAGRFMAGEVRSLVFNCKMEDENLRGGDKYMLVFSIQVDESHTHISGQSGQAYVTYFNLVDACRIIHEFSPSSATMVRIDGAQGVNPYKIDYCPGGAPNVTLNSYSYDITNGQLVQEIGVEYDWYYGTLEDYRKKVVHGEDGVDHTLNEALVNFRFFYPEITEANINTCEPKDPQAKDGIDYVLTQSMIDIIKAEVEAGTLKLRKTNALFELDKAEDENAAYTVVAIKLGKRVTQDEDAEGNKHYYVYCADPVELKFYTNHETPGAAIGLTEVSYSAHTPYNKRDKKGNLVSVPTRISSDQVSDLLSTSRKHYLNLPLSTMLPSGFYQVDKEDGGEQVAEPTSQIKFVIDPENTDVVVAETNDPQWKLYEVSGSEFYMPVVGKLTEINAHKMRKLLPWLKDNEESDVVGIDFTHESIQRKFEPREGYYYVLRANFLETIDEYDGDDDPHGWKDIWKHKPSQKFDNKDLLKCKGTILIPLKIVPQYMKWTGRESTDWNNDRNWIRADKPELVPSEAQNYEGAYATYLVNTTEAEGMACNGLPVPTNDNVERSTDPDADPYEGLDIFVPMEQADNTTDTEESPYSFGYAPMQNTSVIIPSASEVPHAPLLKGHAIGEVAGDNIGVLQLGNDEKNTQIIEYDMVARLKTTTSILGSTRTYEAVPYYENTVKDITFQPGARMMGSEHLTYQKAWVEYALDVDRWYTLASPLQDTYAGEWYAPTGTDASTAAKQLTPYFHDINYTTAHYDRFRPAIFQRSWDAASDYTKMWLKTGGDCNSYIANDWSEVYNNVLKRYDTGGFSVKVEIDEMVQKPQDNVAIVRMPKADTKYTYYDINGQTAGKADDALPVLTNRYRLWTDKLAKSAESFQQTITNAEPGNNYFLVGNPFMTNLDMEAFFQANPQFEKTYWVLSYTDDQQVQSTSVRAAYDQRNADVAEDERWILTDGEGNFAADQAVVAPLQGFFVKTTAVTNTTTVNYTPAMQTLAEPTFKELYSPQLPVIDGGEGDDPNAAPDVLPAEGPMYTISGLRVRDAERTVRLNRGIYIQSGKKQLK